MVDHLFVLAILVLGWGLSLATYRLTAQTFAWPMGALQRERPAVPLALGMSAVAVAGGFALSRGADQGGWIIAVCGVAMGIFWTGFLRAGSQVSLLLAPPAAAILLIGWLGTMAPP